ncbi:MAG: tail fiber domain-containing protein [Clostridium sp.]|nr:tail fiber domain-containing protein [Clostridium sp.]
MSVSNEFKNITKKIKQQNIKLSICDGELTVKEVHMMPVHIFNALPVWKLRKQKETIAKELKYSFNGQLFKTIMKQVEITVKNANEIKDKDINFQYGLFINNKFEYVDLGNYFIKDVEDSKKKDEITVTGYDRMIRFMKTFKQSELQLKYPCKMLKLVQKMCEVCGVELYSTDFYNADLDVEEDFFTAQELTYRDVLEKIAQATLTTAFIEDNKLNLYKVSDDTIEKIDKSYLTDLTIKEKFGPVNVLVLGRGDVEDNIEETDKKSIEQNGRYEIRFDENEFIEFQREQVIKGMFEQIKELEYYAFEASDVGVMWLKPCSCIQLGDKENNFYKSYYLKANITINTGISSDIEAGLPETTNTEYKVTTKEEKKTLKVERLAKKNEGLIQDLVQENSEQSQKLTKVEQTVDSISQKVSDIEDLTRTAEGIKTVTLENCIEANLLELHIYGNNTVFNYLLLDDKLTLDDNLHLEGDDLISVTDKDNNIKTYSLGITEALRQNNEVCDEFVLENGQAKVIRRVNKSGSTKAKESVEDLGKLEIPLKEGTNTITINNYTAKIKAKYVIKSTYSDTFASRVEMNSAITQNSEKIMSEVNKKVDETELGTKIEQNAEAVKFAWNQISEFIQMMIIDGNASLAILDKNKKVLMALDKVGQHFYNSDKTMDIGAFDCYFPSYDNTFKSLMFALNEKATNNFMAWGYKTTAENGDITYTPVVYLGGNSDEDYGFHVENDIILNFNKIRLKKSKIYDNNDSLCFEIGEDLFYGDTRDNKEIFSVYNNSTGTKTFRLFGDDNSPIMIDSDGNLVLANGKIILDNNGNIDCVHLYQTGDSSDIRIKNNIKDSSESAINIINKIHHKEFDKKDDNTHYKIGYIAQEMEQIDKNFVVKKHANKEKGVEERYYINQLPILATVTKAIQEQQAQIEELKKEIETLKGAKE